MPTGPQFIVIYVRIFSFFVFDKCWDFFGREHRQRKQKGHFREIMAAKMDEQPNEMILFSQNIPLEPIRVTNMNHRFDFDFRFSFYNGINSCLYLNEQIRKKWRKKIANECKKLNEDEEIQSKLFCVMFFSYFC